MERRVLEIMGGHPLYFSIDNILYSLPISSLQRMTTGRDNPGLECGKLEEGFYKCARSLAELGHNLIIDNAIVSERSVKRMLEYLTDLDVVMIGISCSVNELIKRELARGDRTRGEAETQSTKIHRYCRYDLSLDSTNTSPKELACSIMSFLKDKPVLHAFSETAQLNHS